MNLWAAGGGMIIWLAGLQSIPEQLYEAASIDGAGAWKRFRHVTLPMLSPYILFNAIVGVIATMQIFGEAFIMTAGGPFESADPDTLRVWWTDVGVHQNLTFPVQPDPISGMHCWHQAVRIRAAEPDDETGDIFVDTAKSREVYKKWLAMTRPADQYSPDGTRRPYWMLRPLKPVREFYKLPS